MESNNDYTIQKLNHLINILEDGKEGYNNASENIKDEVLKNNFLLYSQDRMMYATQLRQKVHQLGGESEDTTGGTVGAIHRVWIDIKSGFTDGETEAVINACITGEEAAISDFKSFENDELIADDFKSLVSEQLYAIEQTLQAIKTHVPTTAE